MTTDNVIRREVVRALSRKRAKRLAEVRWLRKRGRTEGHAKLVRADRERRA